MSNFEQHGASGYVGNFGLYCGYRVGPPLCWAVSTTRDALTTAVEASPRQLAFKVHALHLLGDIAADRDRFDAEIIEGRYRQAAEPLGSVSASSSRQLERLG